MLVPLQSHTSKHFLFIQVCSDATPMHCSTAQGKIASLLFNAALQNRLTACLCHSSYTLEICSLYRCALMHYQITTALVNAEDLPSLFIAALQNRLTAGTVPLQLYVWRFALHTSVQ